MKKRMDRMQVYDVERKLKEQPVFVVVDLLQPQTARDRVKMWLEDVKDEVFDSPEYMEMYEDEESNKFYTVTPDYDEMPDETEDEEEEIEANRDRYFKRNIISKKTEVFKCNTCEYSFSSIFLLQSHEVTIHNHVPRFRCNECRQYFYREEYLIIHTVNRHRVHLTCTICKNEFNNKYSLREHITNVHFNTRTYKCARCKKEFNFLSELRCHENFYRKTKSGPDKNLFKELVVSKTVDLPNMFYELEEGKSIIIDMSMRKYTGQFGFIKSQKFSKKLLRKVDPIRLMSYEKLMSTDYDDDDDDDSENFNGHGVEFDKNAYDDDFDEADGFSHC